MTKKKLIAAVGAIALGAAATALLIRKARTLSLADGYGIRASEPDPTDDDDDDPLPPVKLTPEQKWANPTADPSGWATGTAPFSPAYQFHRDDD